MSGRSGYSAATCLVLVILFVAGCGPRGPETVPIRGEVLLNGKPLKDGIVVYVPKDASTARQASGRIQPDGSFVLTTFKDGDGVVPGEYSIIIYAYEPRPGGPKSREEHEAAAQAGGIQTGYVIPEKYVNPATSGLSDTVDSNHSGFKRVELSG